MRHSYALIGLLLIGLLLVGCAPTSTWPERSAYEMNPLTAEVIADQMLEYGAALQISASEKGEPITDPVILRAIDDAFIEARALQDKAHEMQDNGRIGAFAGKNDNFAAGEVILYGESLYFGYSFESSAAPSTHVYLAKHVAPTTSEELFSEPTRQIGPLKSPFGAQQYHVGTLSNDDWNEFRTVVLYSESMKKIIGIAQIRGLVKK